MLRIALNNIDDPDLLRDLAKNFDDLSHISVGGLNAPNPNPGLPERIEQYVRKSIERVKREQSK